MRVSSPLALVAVSLLACGTGCAPAPGPASPPPPAPKAAPAPAKPVGVDLRGEFKRYGLEPRSQGGRNTCSVFVTTWTIEFALARSRGKGTPLSPEYLNWACNQVIGNRTEDRGQFFHDLLSGFEKHGLCYEEEMPYGPRFDPAVSPSDKALARATELRAKGFAVHWIKRWEANSVGLTDAEMAQVREALTAGWPVAAGSGHSRLLIGFRDDPAQPGGGLYFTRDSGCGSDAEVTYDFVRKNIGDAFWVELAPEREKGR